MESSVVFKISSFVFQFGKNIKVSKECFNKVPFRLIVINCLPFVIFIAWARPDLNYVQSSLKGHCERCQSVCVCAYACLDISTKCHISEAFGGWKASLLGHRQSQVTFLPSLMPMAQHKNISFHQSTVLWCEKSNGIWRGIVSSLDWFRLLSDTLKMVGSCATVHILSWELVLYSNKLIYYILINTTSHCVNHVYTLPPKRSSVIKTFGPGSIFCIFTSVASIFIGKDNKY